MDTPEVLGGADVVAGDASASCIDSSARLSLGAEEG